MKYLSLFSGVEAATLAWASLTDTPKCLIAANPLRLVPTRRVTGVREFHVRQSDALDWLAHPTGRAKRID